jgi:hypothetical protein
MGETLRDGRCDLRRKKKWTRTALDRLHLSLYHITRISQERLGETTVREAMVEPVEPTLTCDGLQPVIMMAKQRLKASRDILRTPPVEALYLWACCHRWRHLLPPLLLLL